MKKKKFFPILCIMILLCGCTSSTTKNLSQHDGQVQIGRNIHVDPPEQLTLFENSDVLAADGLYYATWTDGNSVPYKNSDGDTVDLYDVQLYFLASESSNAKKAEEKCNSWLLAAKENYHVSSEKTITCSDQSYTLISYTCTGDTTPYDHGVSAFATCGETAVCIELTCIESYTEDLEPILTDFLNGCHFETH
ncbi:MAG: hypothetical protein PUG71_02915 [bacterium]|nr:hypothetical protein [bacterium]